MLVLERIWDQKCKFWNACWAVGCLICTQSGTLDLAYLIVFLLFVFLLGGAVHTSRFISKSTCLRSYDSMMFLGYILEHVWHILRFKSASKSIPELDIHQGPTGFSGRSMGTSGGRWPFGGSPGKRELCHLMVGMPFWAPPGGKRELCHLIVGMLFWGFLHAR